MREVAVPVVGARFRCRPWEWRVGRARSLEPSMGRGKAVGDYPGLARWLAVTPTLALLGVAAVVVLLRFSKLGLWLVAMGRVRRSQRHRW